ncbi:DP-EP family protein [Shewanella submarina]|uniref:DP-EP family protein n=1 Tax=Shewanella submarina TaxID=2016376 RepID=A0ABV7GI82_9GAMM|nr:DP-EP family protein [Shewanella submarina]MCL1035584.1 DP-EP family protein [Shewanella submarina]
MALKKITVTVTLDEAGVPLFTYNPPGTVVVTEENTQIIYSLDDQTGKGLSFAGASFANPFDGVIDSVVATPETLTLHDSDQVNGQTGFRLLFNIEGQSLLLNSPDPVVIDKKPTA